MHVFRQNVLWEHVDRLEADDTAAGDFFGTAVAIKDDLLIVGAPRADANGTDSGAVYVFKNDGGTWVQFEKILNPATVTPDGDFFGASVALDGDRIVVGAPRADPGIAGAVYAFVDTGTAIVPDGVIAPLDLMPGDEFGTSVAIDGDEVAIGAVFGDDGADADTGALYLYERITGVWTETGRFVRGVATRDRFGQSVALSGDSLVGGAYLEDSGTVSGAVYTFERDDLGVWSAPIRTEAVDQGAGEHFGFALAIEGTSLIVGAPLDDAGGADTGSAMELEARSCRDGGVARALGAPENVLLVNGSAGDAAHELQVNATGPIIATMSQPSGGGNGKYFVHAHRTEPTNLTIAPLPSKLGASCFQVLLNAGADPDAIFNGIGKEQKIGSSQYFDGTPINDPLRAPSLFLDLPTGDTGELPVGTRLTLQGAIIDPDTISTRGVSLTNAVVLELL